MVTAIFDLDGTLTKRDTLLPYLWLCLREFGFRRISILSLPFYALLYKFGVITNTQLKVLFLSKVLSGLTLDQLIPVTERFITGLFRWGLNNSVVEKLSEHLKKKHRVIIATASLDLYTFRLAEQFGIEHVICTLSEIKDGVLTGRIIGNNCHGQEKVDRLGRILNEADWDRTIFYTDHYSDLPLLKKVKQGVLVDPGLKTRLALRKYGFPIL